MFRHYVLVKFISRLELSSLVDVKNYFRNKISPLRKSERSVHKAKENFKPERFDPFSISLAYLYFFGASEHSKKTWLQKHLFTFVSCHGENREKPETLKQLFRH